MSLSYNAKWLYGKLWSGELPKKEEKPDFDLGVAPEEEVASYNYGDDDDHYDYINQSLEEEDDEDYDPEEDDEEYCDLYGCDMDYQDEDEDAFYYSCWRCGAGETEDKPEPETEDTYYIKWEAFGVSEVLANSEEEAREIFDEGITDFDSIDFLETRIDGYEFKVNDED